MPAKVREQSSSIGSAFGKSWLFVGFAQLGKKLLDFGMYSTQIALEVCQPMNQILSDRWESSRNLSKWVNDNALMMNMGVGVATNFGAQSTNTYFLDL